MLIARRGKSLHARMMALSFAALLPGLIATGYVAYDVTRLRQAEVRDLALRSARQAAFEVDRIFSGVQAVMVGVAAAPVVSRPLAGACTDYMTEVRARLAQLSGLFLVSGDGELQCGSGLELIAGGDAAFQAHLRESRAGADFTIGGFTPLQGPASTPPLAVLPLSLAVPGRNGNPDAVLVALLDLRWLGRQLQERGLPQGGSLTVADAAGVIIARHPAVEQFIGTRIPPAFMHLVHADSAGTELLVSQDGTRRVLGYVPVSQVPRGVYVSAGLSAEASLQPVASAVRIGALLAVGSGLATLLVTWLVGSRVFVQPLRRLQTVVEQWLAGERGARTGARDGDGEIAAVGAAMDRMMDEIVRSQDQRELLAGELAHRVANTLTIVQAIAVSTLGKPAPARELLPAFLARLSALAATHEVLTQSRWDDTDLMAMILKVIQPLAENVERRFRLDGTPVQLPAREALGMTMVIHELCTNALKYGALSVADGIVELGWRVGETPEGQMLTLDWRERHGPPVTASGRSGFGTRLISRAFAEAGAVRVDFDPAGVTCRISLLLGGLQQAA